MRWNLMLALILAVPAAAQPAPAPKLVYLPAPPEPVCGGMVERADWSPDGRYVIAIRRHILSMDVSAEAKAPPMETEVAVWSDAARRATTVLTDKSAGAQIGSLDWYPGSSVALILATSRTVEGETSRAIWRIDARRAAAKFLSGASDGEELTVSPKLPYAFLWQPSGAGVQLRSVSAAGLIGAPMRVEGAAAPTGWSADGARLYFLPASISMGATVKKELEYDVQKGTTAEAQKVIYWEPATRRTPFRLEQGVRVAGQSARWSTPSPASSVASSASAGAEPSLPWTGENPRPLWLVQDGVEPMNRMMIGLDADFYQASPRLDAVLYANREGAFVVPLSKTDGAIMAQAREAAQRAVLMSNGKQIALALMMYMQDNDETYPTQNQDLKALLQPYVKSDSVFAGLNGETNAFQYQYPGATAGDVTNPAETVIGTIAGPGGKAVIYADGHVQWQSGE